MLKDLPPGGFDKAYGYRPSASAAVKPVSFMCDKQCFKDAVRLAELGARLAEQAHTLGEAPADPFVESVLEGIKSLKAKVDQLALDTANLAAKQPAPGKSFADAVTSSKPQGAQRSAVPQGSKGRKPPPASNPVKAPRLHLSQTSSDRPAFVEMTTDARSLALRASSALDAALREHSSEEGRPPPPLSI